MFVANVVCFFVVCCVCLLLCSCYFVRGVALFVGVMYVNEAQWKGSLFFESFRVNAVMNYEVP